MSSINFLSALMIVAVVAVLAVLMGLTHLGTASKDGRGRLYSSDLNYRP